MRSSLCIACKISSVINIGTIRVFTRAIVGTTGCASVYTRQLSARLSERLWSRSVAATIAPIKHPTTHWECVKIWLIRLVFDTNVYPTVCSVLYADSSISNRIWCILALKYNSCGNNFNDSPENQLRKFCLVWTVLREIGTTRSFFQRKTCQNN